MILLCYGTRPEWIKIKPLIEEFKKNNFEYRVLFTGQQVNIGEFEYDWILNIVDKPNRLDSIVSSITAQMWEVFNFFCKYNTETNKFIDAYVLVQGDTTSALAVALSAFNHGIKVIHLEAGLRTHDRQNPYPEEINRKIISQIADVNLCPTKEARQNLVDEKIYEDMFVVGNTVIDNLLPYKDKCEYGNIILVTLHRRENHHWMDQWFIELEKLAIKYSQYDFVLPIHPNPNVMKHRDLLKYVNVAKPLPYDMLLNYLVRSRLVITDSGGLQEECSFFNKKCLVCRKVTERPEVLGKSSFMVSSPEDLSDVFMKHIDNYEINYDCPYGDGHSAEKIMKALNEVML